MSDIWEQIQGDEMKDKEQNGQQPEDTAAQEETPAQPQAPVAEPVSSEPPPLNGWSSNGGYRYVPPRTERPNVPPSAANNPYSYTNAYGWQQPGDGFVPPSPQSPVGGSGNGQPPKKKGSGWIAVLAVLGALVVVASLVLLVYGALNTYNGDPVESLHTQQEDESDHGDNTESTGREDAPSLEISQWDDDDGGLSNKEIANRNMDSTVVLTAYAQTKNFAFGESTLTEAGAASGIVMSADGYIITNWHCVIDEDTGKKYDRIDVTTHNGKTYEDAEVIGADESTDLAVIKVKASGLTAAKFGDSSALSVGDRVVALGNAAGLSWTATFGYVSALARDVYDDTGYAIQCLQVDAAINYGNSGGPLLNNQGLVVGINSAKIAASGYEGLGFAIPINEAKEVIDALLKDGYVRGRVALGITGQSVSSGAYEGFLITTISSGSSLKNTQAQVGDLIVAVDGEKVEDYGSLRTQLAKHKVGESVTLTLLRSEQRTGRVSSFEVTVTLKEQTDD